MTVAHLLHSMSSQEFIEWMAYYAMEPFGPEADDARNALSIAANVNTTRGAAGIRQSVKPHQFLIGKPHRNEEDEENPHLARFMSLTGHLEGTDGDNS
jgi:hypothetical protein